MLIVDNPSVEHRKRIAIERRHHAASVAAAFFSIPFIGNIVAETGIDVDGVIFMMIIEAANEMSRWFVPQQILINTLFEPNELMDLRPRSR